MPPESDPLSEKEIAILKRWIDEGVSWQEGFAFGAPAYVAPLKPRRPELPPAQNGRDHPIDRLIDAHYEKHGIERPAALGDEAFLRRIYLDVIGLLPTPDQRQAFLADPSPEKRQQLVRDLLGNHRRLRRALAHVLERPLAERLLRHWLHRRRPPTSHRLAVSIAAREQAIRPIRPRTDQPCACRGRLR